MKKTLIKKVFGFLAITSLISIGTSFTYAFNKKKKLADKYAHVNFFSGSSIDYANKEFENSSFAVVFSGLEINFSGAKLVNNKGVLNLYGEFSGISVKVPDHWNVRVNGTYKKAGFSNSFVYDEEDTESPLLVINYDIAYSGFEIKRMDYDDFDVDDIVDDEENYFVDEGEDNSKIIKIKRIDE